MSHEALFFLWHCSSHVIPAGGGKAPVSFGAPFKIEEEEEIRKGGEGGGQACVVSVGNYLNILNISSFLFSVLFCHHFIKRW